MIYLKSGRTMIFGPIHFPDFPDFMLSSYRVLFTYLNTVLFVPFLFIRSTISPLAQLVALLDYTVEYVLHRIKPEELYIFSFEKAEGFLKAKNV